MDSTEKRLNYNVVGDGDNLLVLLHAFPVNHQLFDKVKDSMLPEGWRAILPDFPGFGSTPEDETKHMWTMEELARDVYSLITPADYDKLVVGGVSMGGYVTMAFEKEFPSKADAYIFSNTHDQSDADGGEGRKEVVQMIMDDKRQEYLENNLLPRAIGKTTEEERDDVIDFCWQMFDTVSDAAIMQTMRGMGIRGGSRKVFEKLEHPILLICGDEDRITGPDTMKPMAEAYPNAQLEVISKAGHYAAIENPQEYAEAIRSFLEGL